MALQTPANITQADVDQLAELVRPEAFRRFTFAIDALTGRPVLGTLSRGSAFRMQAASLAQARSPEGQIRSQLTGVLQGLPQAFDPEAFLSGFVSRQQPALAGAREQLQSQLAQRGLTGSGAEIGALTGLETGAVRSRTEAFSEFLLRRPSLQLGALGQAAGIIGALRAPPGRTTPFGFAPPRQQQTFPGFQEASVDAQQPVINPLGRLKPGGRF